MNLNDRHKRFQSGVFIAAGFLLLFLTASGAQPQVLLNYGSAMDIAMENSPDIKRTRLDLERSREMLNAQKASLKSNFRLTLEPFTFSRDRTFNTFLSDWSSTKTTSSLGTFSVTQPIVKTDGTLSLTNRFSWQDSYSDYRDIRDRSFNNNLYISFDQPIFTYNRTELELRELELDLESSMLTFAVQSLSLESQVAQSFYNAYEAILNLDIAEEELRNNEQNFELIKNKVDAGLLAEEEIFQAELNLASSRSNVENRRVILENSYDSLKPLIGLSLDEPIAIEATVSFDYVDVSLEKALDNALRNRLELKQRQIDLDNAQFNLTRVRAQNEFKGSVSLSYGIIGTDEDFTNLYDNATRREGVGISFEIPLWDWGENESRVKASETTIKSRKLSIEDEKTSISIAIRRAYRNLNNLVSQIDIAEQSIRNAEKTYEINLERYKNGDLTGMDLNLYQAQLSQRKIALVQSQIDYKLGLLEMKILTLWDFENDKPVLPEEIFQEK